MRRWRATVRATLGAFHLDVDLRSEGRVMALIGENGSGKTTLLRILAGAVPTEVAEIEVDGVVLASTSQRRHLPIEARQLGYVPQGYGLFPHLNVLDNVAFSLTTAPHALNRSRRQARARSLLEALGCAELADRRVQRLSGGEKQRVALARALALDPRMLLLDEPLAALDAATRRSVRGFLAEHLTRLGRPALITTHDLRDVEALQAEVVVLDRGAVVQRGELGDLRAAPVNAFVEEFVGS